MGGPRSFAHGLGEVVAGPRVTSRGLSQLVVLAGSADLLGGVEETDALLAVQNRAVAGDICDALGRDAGRPRSAPEEGPARTCARRCHHICARTTANQLAHFPHHLTYIVTWRRIRNRQLTASDFAGRASESAKLNH
jgi:hypothetical protein